MKPLSICICYLASLYACFKAFQLYDAPSAFVASCLIALAGHTAFKQINQTEK